jgi:indole-3-glycerol phosphate synthase/phosphoribosylanthranilate isomerase
MNVLEKIVADKSEEIAQRKRALPLADFVEQLVPSDRSLYQALAEEHAGYILECKKASPSKGLIRSPFDLDEIIHAYQPYAAAISVLTDEKYFQGKFDYLSYVRDRVSQPVLNKDFFIDPYQVHLARYHKADAILLMLSVLDDQQYQQLAQLADHYQLDVLTEVSNEQEMHRAIALGARIIGINNRNLRDLSTDLATTEQLVPIVKAAGHDCMLISESGINQHQDVRRLAPQVDGFLVGSSLMAQANLKQAVEALVYGRVKICGITNIEDASAVADSPARYAGLIFVTHSKRVVSLEQANQIVQQVPFNYVGVFANQTAEQVAAIAKQLNLCAVQLHGNEDKTYISALKPLLPASCEIWQVEGIAPDQTPLLNLEGADRLLLDCKLGEQSGGTGTTFNWKLLSNADNKHLLILAGGINPDNVNQAVNTGCGILDVNSGVERAPAIKDANLISRLFAQLRNY